jgi:hypothetical protein
VQNIADRLFGKLAVGKALRPLMAFVMVLSYWCYAMLVHKIRLVARPHRSRRSRPAAGKRIWAAQRHRR